MDFWTSTVPHELTVTTEESDVGFTGLDAVAPLEEGSTDVVDGDRPFEGPGWTYREWTDGERSMDSDVAP